MGTYVGTYIYVYRSQFNAYIFTSVPVYRDN